MPLQVIHRVATLIATPNVSGLNGLASQYAFEGSLETSGGLSAEQMTMAVGGHRFLT